MNKLTVEKIMCYLPFNPNVNLCDLQGNIKFKNRAIRSFEIKMGFKDFHLITGNRTVHYLDGIKLLLRPLSDLNKEIKYKGEKFIPQNKIDKRFRQQFKNFKKAGEINTENWYIFPYEIIEQLFKWKFDVYGLIDDGLAHNIKSLAN